MNKTRRNAIETVKGKLSDLAEVINNLMDEEQEAFDNMPEGLQYSSRGEAMQEAIDALDSAVRCFEELDEYLEEAVNH